MSHTLLLADDSVTIQRVIELTFADEDIRVIAVGDGQQAIDRITADPPDIVLADTGMPERDGYEVATFIKEDPALAHIPVVLLTGAFEPVDEDRARQVGCDAVLVKPFELKVVINRVRELLGKRSAAVDPATSGPVTVVPPQDADADALTLRAETTGHPTHDPDETLELGSRVSSGGPESAPPPDDPLADYLDRMDEAFDRFEAGESAASGRERTGSEEPRPTPKDTSASEENFDSLAGALSVLEGALDQRGLESLDAKADDAPAGPDVPPFTPDAASPPPDRSAEAPVPAAGSGSADEAPATPVPQVPSPAASVAPVASAPHPTSEVMFGLTSLTEVPRPVDAQEPLPEPAAPPEPVVVSAPAPVPPPPQRSPEAVAPPAELAPPPAPVDTPPSLADAFASLLAAEQGGAERAQTLYPWPRPASSPGMHEALIDQVVERVIARLSDGVTGELVADVVARVAEKLVREALERRKPV